MPARLHTRFAVGFAALLIVLGLVLAVAITHVAERYHAEVSQRLNAGIAMYVTNELSLLDARGVNDSAFRELARRVMTVNPSAEAYHLRVMLREYAFADVDLLRQLRAAEAKLTPRKVQSPPR